MRFLPDRALLDYSLNRYKKQNLFWFFRTWVTWATANVTTNNWFHHHGSVTALQSPYPRCPPNPLKGECQCRQVGTRLGTSAARQCLARRLSRSSRLFIWQIRQAVKMVHTDSHRFSQIISVHSVYSVCDKPQPGSKCLTQIKQIEQIKILPNLWKSVCDTPAMQPHWPSPSSGRAKGSGVRYHWPISRQRHIPKTLHKLFKQKKKQFQQLMFYKLLKHETNQAFQQLIISYFADIYFSASLSAVYNIINCYN